MLKSHAACEAVQWLCMKEWVEDRETKCDDRHKDNVLWGMDIADMTLEKVAKARVGEVAPAQEARNDRRDKTARQEGGGVAVSQHAGPTQDGGPQKCQLQQQPKPKLKLQCTMQRPLRHEPKPKPTPTSAGTCDAIQL